MNCFSCVNDDEKPTRLINVLPTLPNGHIRAIPSAHFPNASASRVTLAEKKRNLREQEEKLEHDYPSVSLALHARPFHSYSMEVLNYYKGLPLKQAVKNLSPSIFNGFIRKHLEKVPAR